MSETQAPYGVGGKTPGKRKDRTMGVKEKTGIEKTGSELLECFPNPSPERDYTLHIRIPEFTCLCPRTGQPDFAVLELDYVPDALCIELKSLKLYIHSYRNRGAFHEAVSNRILDDLKEAMAPRFLRLIARFNTRGGIQTTVTVEYRRPDWSPSDPCAAASLP